MQKNIFATILLLAISLPLTAQTSLFSYNPYRYNPAAVATTSTNAITIAFNSYTNLHLGLTSYSDINLEHRLSKYHSAIGFNSPSITWNGPGWDHYMRGYNLTYAYQWQLTHKENSPHIAFGLQSGFSREVSLWNGVGQGPQYKNYTNLDAGIYFYLPNQKFYAGLSRINLLYPDKYYPSASFNGPHSYYQFLTGYRFTLVKNTYLQPNFLIKTINFYNSPIIKLQPTINLQLQHKKYEIGCNYYIWGEQSSIGINAGFCFAKRFYLRAQYDRIITPLWGIYKLKTLTLMLAYRSIK